MNGTLAIFKKEMRAYFNSPLAHVIITVLLLVMGLFFYLYCLVFAQSSGRAMFGQGQAMSVDTMISNYLQNLGFIINFATPFLAMRLFSEEKRQHTMELLLTAPVTSFQIVLAKFFSVWALFFVMVTLCSLHLLFPIMWGNPEIPTLLTSLLGVFLMVGSFLSVGLLITACTSSQVVAGIIGLIVVLFLYIANFLGNQMNLKFGPIDIGAFVSYMTPLEHFQSFSQGVIHFKDLVYYFTFISFFLFLTNKVIESNRWR